MKLTNKHLQVIYQGIIKLECYSCQFISECQSGQDKYCNEISRWLGEQEEE